MLIYAAFCELLAQDLCLKNLYSYVICYINTKMAWVVQMSGSGMACLVGFFLCELCRRCTQRMSGVFVGAGSYVSSFGDLLWVWLSLLCCSALVIVYR
jgi:hypothetical protein